MREYYTRRPEKPIEAFECFCRGLSFDAAYSAGRVYCDEELSKCVKKARAAFNGDGRSESYLNARSKVNPYEKTRKSFLMNGASVKLANIDSGRRRRKLCMARTRRSLTGVFFCARRPPVLFF